MDPVNLVRLGEDLLQTLPIYHQHKYLIRKGGPEYKYVSNIISRYVASPMDLPSEEGIALAKRFHSVPFPRTFPLGLCCLWWVDRICRTSLCDYLVEPVG